MSPVALTFRAVTHRYLDHRAIFGDPIRRGYDRARLVAEGEIKKRWPRDTSTSFRSIGSEVLPGDPPRGARVWVASGYGDVIERGRRAGAPPPPAQALLPWVRRHGMPPSAAYPIARAIGRRGLKGRYAFRDGGRAAMPAIRSIFNGPVRSDVRAWRNRAPGAA